MTSEEILSNEANKEINWDLLSQSTIIVSPKEPRPTSSSTFIVDEVEIDMDCKKENRYVSEVYILRCPYCKRWTVRYLSRIPADFCKKKNEKEKYRLVTCKLYASPQHKYCLWGVGSEYVTHSDTFYSGWTGDHTERVWTFVSTDASALLVSGLSKKMTERLIPIAHDSQEKTQEVIVSERPINPMSFCTDYVTYPHQTCLILKVIEEAIKDLKPMTQGKLKIYRVEEKELPPFVQFNKRPNILFFDHLIDPSNEVHRNRIIGYSFFESNKYIFLKATHKIKVIAKHYEDICLKKGVYVLVHPC